MGPKETQKLKVTFEGDVFGHATAHWWLQFRLIIVLFDHVFCVWLVAFSVIASKG